MSLKMINSENYDLRLLGLLNNKCGADVVTGKLDFGGITLERKSEFIIEYLKSVNNVVNVICKILYWEKDDVVKRFASDFGLKSIHFTAPYRNGEKPGVCFVEDVEKNEFFLKTLLHNHFNHEMAIEPSLNMRVQLCINQENLITILDIYDDRGVNLYFLGSSL